MCGIVAYIGKKQAFPIVLKGLKRLEYRGYDSAGIAVLNGEALNMFKRSGKVANLEAYAMEHNTEGHAAIGLRHSNIIIIAMSLISDNKMLGRQMIFSKKNNP